MPVCRCDKGLIEWNRKERTKYFVAVQRKLEDYGHPALLPLLVITQLILATRKKLHNTVSVTKCEAKYNSKIRFFFFFKGVLIHGLLGHLKQLSTATSNTTTHIHTHTHT